MNVDLRRSLFGCAIALLIVYPGCVEHPRFEPNGEIIGGHPKLQAALKYITVDAAKEDESMAKDHLCVWYLGSIGGGPLASWKTYSFGSRTDSETTFAKVQLASSKSTIESAESMIYWKVIIRPDGASRILTNPLHWDRKTEQWIPGLASGDPKWWP